MDFLICKKVEASPNDSKNKFRFVTEKIDFFFIKESFLRKKILFEKFGFEIFDTERVGSENFQHQKILFRKNLAPNIFEPKILNSRD